jgi:hypothetical protein
MAGWSSDGGEKLRTPVQLGPATAAEKRALFFSELKYKAILGGYRSPQPP